jgi:hypothetical protein
MIRCTCCRPLTSPRAVREVRQTQVAEAAEAAADGVDVAAVAVAMGLPSSRLQRRPWVP